MRRGPRVERTGRAVMLIAMVVLAPARPATPLSLVLSIGGPAEDPAYLPVYAAAALGIFEAEGVEVTLRRAKHATAAMDTLRDREAAIAVTTLDQAVRGGWMRDTPVRVLVAHTRAPAAALLVSAAPGERVERIADLRGKRIGIPGPGTTGHLLLSALLQAARLEPWQVTVQSFGGASLVTRLGSGDLAAALVDEPWVSRAIAAGAARPLVDFRHPAEADRVLRGPFYEVVSVVRSEPTGATGGKDDKGKKGTKVQKTDKPSPADPALVGFARALIRVQAWLSATSPDEVADRLASLVGDRDRFLTRFRPFQETYSANGEATKAGLETTLQVLRGGSPWPVTLKIEPADLVEPSFVSEARASLGPRPPPP